MGRLRNAGSVHMRSRWLFLAGLIGILLLSGISGCGKKEGLQEESRSSLQEENALAAERVPEKETESKAEMERKTREDEAAASLQPKELSGLLKADGFRFEDLSGNQLILVQKRGEGAVISCFSKDENGVWVVEGELSEIPAFAGFNGIGKKAKEGDGMTPLGLYRLGFAFGNLENPGTAVEFRPITENSYWVDDAASEDYNRWVEGFDPSRFQSAEHLREHAGYNYAIVIEYNYDDPVKGLGSAIFLHCGDGVTSGCVAVSEEHMVKILKWVQDGAQIFITQGNQ